ADRAAGEAEGEAPRELGALDLDLVDRGLRLLLPILVLDLDRRLIVFTSREEHEAARRRDRHLDGEADDGDEDGEGGGDAEEGRVEAERRRLADADAVDADRDDRREDLDRGDEEDGADGELHPEGASRKDVDEIIEDMD